MSDFDFNLTANNISIEFTCPFCSKENKTEFFYNPEPDYSAETGSESTNSEYYEHNCTNCDCEELFNIELHNSYNGGYGRIESENDINKDIEISNIDEIFPEDDYNDFYDDYDYYAEVKYYEEFKNGISEIYCILEENKKSLCKNPLYKMLYAHTITIMETYLSDTLIQKILSSEEIRRKFIENYKDYDNKQIYKKLYITS